MDDPVLLSRLQFALTIMFHYLFPPLTIGMGVVLVYLEGMFLWRREPVYETAARFWTQLFAVTFAVGVATGIVMEFQFGTNWSVYSRFVGDVFGSALAAEGIFAFFLESGFLAVLVFGWDKVGPRFHFFATVMVALGSIFSAVWIVVANSWQQTPAGHHIVQMMRDGEPWFVNGEPILRAEIVSFWDLVFNPSTVDRLTHTLIGAFIMGSFFIMSISAYYLLRGRHREFAQRSFTGALIFGAVFSLLQLVSGHSNAVMVAEEQPTKLAAFEGVFETGPADLSLFGFPDAEEGVVHGNVAIPGGLSFLVHFDWDEPVIGLDRFEREHWPPVGLSFWSYHVMVGLGMFFIAVTLLALVLRWRGRLFDQRWLLWVFVFAVLGAVVANQLGWVAAEVGRQPWVVYPVLERDADGGVVLDENGLAVFQHVEEFPRAEGPRIAALKTSEAVSEAVTAGQVLGSILMFSFIYVLLGALWVFVLNHKIHAGPQPVRTMPPTHRRGVASAAAGRVSHDERLTEEEDER
jgi:cytochrome d ubiquinol oxidase subunit I